MAPSSQGFRGVRIAIIALLLIVVLCVVAQVAVSRIFSASYLEEFLQDNLNASAEVEKVKVNLFAKQVTLEGLTLLPKDSSVRATGIKVREVRLGVKALPLLSRRLETTSFVISNPEIRTALDREGELSVAELFRSPKEEEIKSLDSSDKNLANKSKGSKNGVLEAQENRWLAQLGETRLEGGRLEMLFEKEKLLLRVESLDLTVNDLQFDPEDLATLNQVEMSLSAKAQLHDSEGLVLVNLNLRGGVEGKLFDVETGDLDADVLAALSLEEGSYLNPQTRIVRRIWGYLDQVEKLGISLGELPQEIGFGRSRQIIAGYRDDRVTLAQPLSLSAGKWEVGLARDSWIATESGLHEIGVEFLVGKDLSQTVGGWLDALPKEAQILVQKRFIDEQQVLWRVNSSGELKDPQFDFLSQLPEASGLIEGLEDSLEEEMDRIKKKAGSFLNNLLD